MEYLKIIKKKAKKFIDKQDKKQRERIYMAIDALPSGDIKALQENKRQRVNHTLCFFSFERCRKLVKSDRYSKATFLIKNITKKD